MDAKEIFELQRAYEKVSQHAFNLELATYKLERNERFEGEPLNSVHEIFLDFFEQPDSDIFGPTTVMTGERLVLEGNYTGYERLLTSPNGIKVKLFYIHDVGKHYAMEFDKSNPEAEYLEKKFEKAGIHVGTIMNLKEGESYPDGYIADNIKTAQELHSMIFPLEN